MLEMCFSTAPWVTTSSRAIGRVRAALGDQLEGLALAGGERVDRRVPRIAMALAHQRADHLAIERGAARRHPAHRVHERPHLGDALLEQVADAATRPRPAARPSRPARRTARARAARATGWRRRASSAARIPSSVNVGGRRTSQIARSGLWPATIRSRPGPSSAVAATSIPFSLSSATRPSRSSAWSSTITTRIGASPRSCWVTGTAGSPARSCPRRPGCAPRASRRAPPRADAARSARCPSGRRRRRPRR